MICHACKCREAMTENVYCGPCDRKELLAEAVYGLSWFAVFGTLALAAVLALA